MDGFVTTAMMVFQGLSLPTVKSRDARLNLDHAVHVWFVVSAGGWFKLVIHPFFHRFFGKGFGEPLHDLLFGVEVASVHQGERGERLSAAVMKFELENVFLSNA